MRSNRGQIRSLEACWSLEVTSGQRPPKMHMSSYEVTWDHKGFHAKFGSEMTPFFCASATAPFFNLRDLCIFFVSAFVCPALLICMDFRYFDYAV